MTYRSFLATLLRIAGLVIFISALTTTPSTFSSLLALADSADPSLGELFVFAAAAVAPGAALGLFLVSFPGAIVRSLLPRSPGSGWIYHPLAAGFFALGVYLVWNLSAPAGFYADRLALYLQAVDLFDALASVAASADFSVLALVAVQFLIGVALVFGGPSLALLSARGDTAA